MPQKTRLKGGHAATKTEQRMQAPPPPSDPEDKTATVHPKRAGIRSMVIAPKETPKERMARILGRPR